MAAGQVPSMRLGQKPSAALREIRGAVALAQVKSSEELRVACEAFSDLNSFSKLKNEGCLRAVCCAITACS